MSKTYHSFKDFYPFYLSQHQNKVCRILHYIGSIIALCLWVMAVMTLQPVYFIYGIITGYAFAWVGHFFFEKNRPATFQYPWYSFIGDWQMLKDAIIKNTK